jgi:hypothetical protein
MIKLNAATRIMASSEIEHVQKILKPILGDSHPSPSGTSITWAKGEFPTQLDEIEGGIRLTFNPKMRKAWFGVEGTNSADLLKKLRTKAEKMLDKLKREPNFESVKDVLEAFSKVR